MATTLQHHRSTTSVDMEFDQSLLARTDAAQYVEDMCTELATMADRAGLGFLAYLLEVAREEASIHGQETGMRVMHGELPPV